jgi:CheY-like chemotaxis protein
MRTLILADDNITVQRVIALTFANEPIQVVACSDGQQAIDRMAAQPPDIVLAATSLPTVNGYDLARFIRNQPELRHVPVLLLSGAFENVDEARVVSSGASGVIEKPVEPTNVIGRVRELLGLKSDDKPAPTGRLITPASAPKDRPAAPPKGKQVPAAAPPRGVTPSHGVTPSRATPPAKEPQREKTGIQPPPPAIQDPPSKPDDYLDTLDDAFDTLDQQLSGRAANAKPSRNPSGPLGQASGAPDPRSPGRHPKNSAGTPDGGNPVFEVDDEWFGGDESGALANARAGRREIQDDLRAPELQGPAAEPSPNAVFEVDAEWFAEDDKARAAKLEEHRTLAAEMGIHEVELPPSGPAPNAAGPLSDRDFDFDLEDIKKLQESAPVPVVEEVAHAAVVPPELIDELPPPTIETAAPVAPQAEAAVAPEAPSAPQAPEARYAPQAPDFVDDFAQLLAFEQGEHHEPPMPPAPEVRYVAPEITDAMLDVIASRVADRLSAGPFGEKLREAMLTTIREVTKAVADESAERVVREVAVDTSERVVRQVASDTSDRVAREVASETSERVVRDVAVETAERIVREVAVETSQRVVRDVAVETAERVVREVASETAERVVRDVAFETAERVVRDVASERADRVVRDVAFETSDRVLREVASETAERIAREVTAETSARVAREVVSETAERLVRDEIERIKGKHQ